MSTPNDTELLFAYNADSGLGNALVDYGKKYLQPSKYDCQLCMVTYGPFGMKSDWKKFVKTLPAPAVFLHKDELRDKYPAIDIALPAVVTVKAGKLDRVLLDRSEFQNISSLDDLKQLLAEKLLP